MQKNKLMETLNPILDELFQAVNDAMERTSENLTTIKYLQKEIAEDTASMKDLLSAVGETNSRMYAIEETLEDYLDKISPSEDEDEDDLDDEEDNLDDEEDEDELEEELDEEEESQD